MGYKLLTPGPLSTTQTVKEAMLVDHCTWDEDYKIITRAICKHLLEIAEVDEKDYAAVLMQGSGSFCVEAVLSSVITDEDRILICSNGAYGKRMVSMAECYNIDHVVYEVSENEIPDPKKIKEILDHDHTISALALVHSETTSGVLNELADIAQITQAYGLLFIVDAMSSFGGIPIPMEELGIHFLISSANKCIQGVPGFAFAICQRKALVASAGNARTVSLDLFDQYRVMDIDGKWRFTSPTHTVLAFRQALRELAEEGGVEARYQRYLKNNQILSEEMAYLGFEHCVKQHQGPFITSFYYPETSDFKFDDFYHYLKDHGYAIYPGKISQINSFRIGNIGDVFPEDMYLLTEKISDYMKEIKSEDD